VNALSFDQVHEVIARFVPLARWSGLAGTGASSVLRTADPMLGPDGELRAYACYTPSPRRFAIHPAEGEDPWRASENTIGAMVNPTALADEAFAEACYRYLLAREAGEDPDTPWRDEPVLWPRRLTRTEDLTQARHFIPDLRPHEEVVHARSVLGDVTYLARRIPGVGWVDFDWFDGDGQRVKIRPAVDSLVGTVRTWRIFLEGFLEHPVPFMLDADGHRATEQTRGWLRPAEILITGIDRTGRTDWVEGAAAETLVPDEGSWDRVLASLGDMPGTDLAAGGLAPRTARAIRAGRTPSPRSIEAARTIVARRAHAEAGLANDDIRVCHAPGCVTPLHGRQRSFCSTHAAYPGSRRKAWKEAAGA
jgi:hypothetical protein